MIKKIVLAVWIGICIARIAVNVHGENHDTKYFINGIVIQFVENDCILVGVLHSTRVGIPQLPDGSAVFVRGKFADLADNDRIAMLAHDIGFYKYANKDGVPRKVRAFELDKMMVPDRAP